ncbi:GNAT family acetyltransferase [Brevundimonas sp. 'scallop']|uniref:GNAT family acetyltransferase n=1 Tax=Brevundimonas sp. 'scallop' TaxID=2562582 RepID=UPI0013E1A4DC|nr:GNAT family acetyltransferase [Brevundimonas sp. 'scallop']QIF81326.1 GNAT family acetyltransferase [Brevundimonas sp. 'scallop']
MSHIRPIVDGDEADVIGLWSACGLTRPWNDPAQDLKLARDTATSIVLVATNADQIVGSVMTGFEGHRGWVYYLAVDPRHRGTGLGRRLMTAAEDWLMTQGAPKLQLMVRAGNRAALTFYERLGLERQDVVVMGRRLDG